jgi:DNA-directed RNA polymerase subunit D
MQEKRRKARKESIMKIELLKKEDRMVSFLVEDSTDYFINTIRRIAMAEVPVLAIEDVEFRKNSSVLYDEMIALRLGLLPLTTDLKSYTLPSECGCKGEGCAKCQVKLTLKIPKEKGEGMVCASDMKSKDPEVKPVYPKMPIVKLIKEQQLELEATAMLGKGKKHVKWSPGLIYYRAVPEVELTGKGTENKELVALCPKHIFELKGNKVAVEKDNLMDCDMCLACADQFPDAVKVTGKTNDFIFTIESWGQLSPKEILIRASEIFDEKLDAFATLVKEAE